MKRDMFEKAKITINGNFKVIDRIMLDKLALKIEKKYVNTIINRNYVARSRSTIIIENRLSKTKAYYSFKKNRICITLNSNISKKNNENKVYMVYAEVIDLYNDLLRGKRFRNYISSIDINLEYAVDLNNNYKYIMTYKNNKDWNIRERATYSVDAKNRTLKVMSIVKDSNMKLNFNDVDNLFAETVCSAKRHIKCLKEKGMMLKSE